MWNDEVPGSNPGGDERIIHVLGSSEIGHVEHVVTGVAGTRVTRRIVV